MNTLTKRYLNMKKPKKVNTHRRNAVPGTLYNPNNSSEIRINNLPITMRGNTKKSK